MKACPPVMIEVILSRSITVTFSCPIEKCIFFISKARSRDSHESILQQKRNLKESDLEKLQITKMQLLSLPKMFFENQSSEKNWFSSTFNRDVIEYCTRIYRTQTTEEC